MALSMVTLEPGWGYAPEAKLARALSYGTVQTMGSRFSEPRLVAGGGEEAQHGGVSAWE
jgi:hypothetical protein